jgi:predicted nucleic acid-binding Zn ribbon protein
MPVHSYTCESGHTTEKLYRSITQAEVEKFRDIACRTCGDPASLRVYSLPSPALLLGSGWYKPAATRRKLEANSAE